MHIMHDGHPCHCLPCLIACHVTGWALLQLGIGICTKVTAEYAKRQGRFGQELDFVAANVLMALIADFMLVWLPAPTLSYTAAKVR